MGERTEPGQKDGEPAQPAGTPGGRVGRSAATLALVIACMAVFVTALDQTVVVTALQPIMKDLQIPSEHLDQAAWIISGYLLGYVIVMPLMGRVSDMYGRRRIFMLCLAIFGLASLACALANPAILESFGVSLSFQHKFANAQDQFALWLKPLGLNSCAADNASSQCVQSGLVWLVPARFIQAIGGGAVVPVAMALAGDYFGIRRRGLMLGIIGAVTEAGGALGPLYGAGIIQLFNGWAWIFLLNVPLVFILMVAGWFLVPRGGHARARVDWLGALLLGASLACLSLGLSQNAGQTGFSLTATAENNPLLVGSALLLLVLFVAREIFSRSAMIEVRLFRQRAFSASIISSLLVGAVLIVALVDIPIFYLTVVNGTILQTGLSLLCMTVWIPLSAVVGGWLCHRIGCHLTGALALLLIAVGFFLMRFWPVNLGWPQLIGDTLVMGVGFGLVVAPLGTSTLNAAGAARGGMASAVVTSARMIGMILGLAALTSYGLARFRQLSAGYTLQQLNQPGAFSDLLRELYSEIFTAAAILCLVALLPAALLWREADQERLAAAAPRGELAATERDAEQRGEAALLLDARPREDIPGNHD
ncbi:MAG TPA: MFS transporter [Ktedonobacterales bacterium]|jgi:MFS family permease